MTGRTSTRERERLYARFRDGDLRLLVVSKVANFAIDLPEANVAIQVSGTFGSRQEEAQRLGRILRPKSDGGAASFYTLVSRETNDQEYAAHRQLFLTEQGYRYLIVDESEVVSPPELLDVHDDDDVRAARAGGNLDGDGAGRGHRAPGPTTRGR